MTGRDTLRLTWMKYTETERKTKSFLSVPIVVGRHLTRDREMNSVARKTWSIKVGKDPKAYFLSTLIYSLALAPVDDQMIGEAC